MLLTASSGTTDVLRDARLGTVFQPVVDLHSRRVLGNEALMRVQMSGRDVAPLAVLTHARSRGAVELATLDLAALDRAVTAASKAGGGVLLVNVEPSTLANHVGEIISVLERRAPGLYVVVEVTERALAADPAGLLRAAEALRAKGYPLALDDVGTNPQSLALLDVIRPRIVKIDMAMLRNYADQASLHVCAAVVGYAETVGAYVVAVGIETEEDLEHARVLGADLGQGTFFGRPSAQWPAHSTDSPLRLPCPPPVPARGPSDTPFSVIAKRRKTHSASWDMLLPLSRAVEASVAQSHLPAIVLASVQQAYDLDAGTVRRFARLSSSLPVVGMIGDAVTGLDLPGVFLADTSPGDPLCLEWNLVALGAQSAVALTARERPPMPGYERTYAFATTRDRSLVVAAATTLIGRLGARR